MFYVAYIRYVSFADYFYFVPVNSFLHLIMTSDLIYQTA
jgi:hypothetical protein